MEYTVDVSKPVTNPELVKAISQMRSLGTRESSEEVIKQIYKAQFLIPIVLDKEPVKNEDGTVTFKEKTKFSFPLLQNAKKESYFMAFTDWSELYKWNAGKDQKTAVFTFSDYVSLLAGHNSEGAAGFVINPFGGNLTLTNSMIHSLEKRQQP